MKAQRSRLQEASLPVRLQGGQSHCAASLAHQELVDAGLPGIAWRAASLVGGNADRIMVPRLMMYFKWYLKCSCYLLIQPPNISDLTMKLHPPLVPLLDGGSRVSRQKVPSVSVTWARVPVFLPTYEARCSLSPLHISSEATHWQ